MFATTTRRAALAALAAAILPGCGPWSMQGDEGNYRTVTAQPGRNTAAARRQNQEGLARLAADDLEGAEKAFARALTADVEFGPAHNNLGKIHYRRGDWYQAAWEFEFARKLLPDNPEPCNNLGLVREVQGRLDMAVDHYRQAVDLAPDNIHYAANLARALHKRGDRTGELHGLLRQIIEQDDRPAWRAWARRQLTAIGQAGP